MKKLNELVTIEDEHFSEIIYFDEIKEWAREWIKELEKRYNKICALSRKSGMSFEDSTKDIIDWIKENLLEEEWTDDEQYKVDEE